MQRKMLFAISISIMGAISCLFAKDSGYAESKEGASRKRTMNVIASASYSVAGITRQLALCKEELPPHPNLIEYFTENPEKTDFPNLLFTVVDFPFESSKDGKVVWIEYVYHHKTMIPTESWIGDIVWHPRRNLAYVIIARSISSDLTLSVYEVELNKEIGAFPLQLGARNHKSWPTPSPLASKFHKDLWDGEHVCGVNRIKVIPERNHLMICLQREHKDCKPVYFRFNFDTNEWFLVKIESRKVKED